jgi:hypothetical protein
MHDKKNRLMFLWADSMRLCEHEPNSLTKNQDVNLNFKIFV